MTRVEQEILDQPEVERLFREADERSAEINPGEDRPGPTVAALLAAGVRFFVARVDGRAVGCAGFVPGDGWAEVTRVFVAAEARGRGIGRALLEAVEQLAANERFAAMRLETGRRNVEAIRLYRRLGYADRPAYGVHAEDVSSLFMEKALTRDTEATEGG